MTDYPDDNCSLDVLASLAARAHAHPRAVVATITVRSADGVLESFEREEMATAELVRAIACLPGGAGKPATLQVPSPEADPDMQAVRRAVAGMLVSMSDLSERLTASAEGFTQIASAYAAQVAMIRAAFGIDDEQPGSETRQ